MELGPDDYERYDQHLGSAAEAALATGNEQLAALLVDCHVADVTYMDSLMSLTSEEVWVGVRVHLEVPAHVAARFSQELVGDLQSLLNTTLMPEGETVLEISLRGERAAPGWRDRVVPSLNLESPNKDKR